MKKTNLTNEHFLKVLKECLEEIDKNIKSNLGVLLTMYKKLQFEKWFQIELFKHLAEKLKDYDVEIHIEYELSQKTSKRGQSIDITIIQSGKEFIGLELKIAPTNYDITGFSKKTKRITDIIDDFISDLDKTTGFVHSLSLALIFPFPTNKIHRNYEDFKKQELRMIEKGNLTIWEGLQMEDFIARYYLLAK
ncbi:MAG: hypothetical protein RL308_2939 [Bacteroidota bacterium]|jgi:hypothetical protein